MNRRTSSLLLAAWLLLPGALLAQPSASTGGADRTPQMYEDIEVLRRLLTSKLESQYAPLKTQERQERFLVTMQCSNCHVYSLNNFQNYLLTNPYDQNPYLQRQGNSINQGLWPTYSQDFQKYHYNTTLSTAHPAPLPGIEGTYLKGIGVIYTVTLPPPDRTAEAEPVKQAPAPVSDWDRIRREVRNEKPEPEPKKEPTRQPTLEEVLLKVLADNGHHLNQLGENETVTIIVTFRKMDFLHPTGTGKDQVIQTYTPNYENISKPGAQQPTPGQPAADNASEKRKQDAVSEYELLGDLHQKQSKYDDAVKAYLAAIKNKPDAAHEAILWRKVASVYLAQGKDKAAREALDKALEAATVADIKDPPKKADPAPQASSLPAKLIVSAPRKVLDQVGAGKMSFDDFRKAASVEFLNFPPQK